MSGFDREDKEDKQSYQKMVALCVAAASLVMLLFLVVLYVNSDSKKDKGPLKAEITDDEDDFLKDANNIRSEDLGFWKNYESPEDLQSDEEGETTKYRRGDENSSDEEDTDEDDDNSDGEYSEDGDESETDDSSGDGSVKKKKKKKDKNGLVKDNEEENDSMTKNPDDDPDTIDNNEDANHIAVVDDKGNKKLYEVLSSAEKHAYDLKNNISRENGRLSYEDNNVKAKVGIDLSKYNGTVDWEKVKEDNIDFAMLRIAARGYENGTMILDEKFVEYAQGAKMNDIPIGVYVFSQATSDVEAVEEANYAVGAITNFDVRYPIAVDIEVAPDNSYRTCNVTAKDRTHYAKLFCDTVASYGYHPIIYAKRDLLISGINLEDLQGYDIWLADESVPTDFPYRFNMWQYDTRGSVAGIDTNVDIDLSFEVKSR